MPMSLSYYLTKLHKDFVDYCNHILSQKGLSQGLLFFILYIGKHEACSPTDVSRSLNMDSGHVARSLTKLEQSEFIVQEVNSRDKRAKILRLTEKGEEMLKFSRDLLAKWDEKIMADLPKNERAALFETLELLVKNTKSMSL